MTCPAAGLRQSAALRIALLLLHAMTPARQALYTMVVGSRLALQVTPGWPVFPKCPEVAASCADQALLGCLVVSLNRTGTQACLLEVHQHWQQSCLLLLLGCSCSGQLLPA